MKANLSIIVTTHNKPLEQIIECMDSIKEQTVKPLEVILVDDCSKDPRAHALATSIMLPSNVGVAKARDIGVRMSSGKLLLFVDADDRLAPDFIEQCGKVIDECDIAYPNVLRFGDIEINELAESPKAITPEYIIGKKCGLVVTSMMHRGVYDILGGFNQLPIFEDWDFWIRAIHHGYTFKKANTLLWYRQNGRTSRNKMPKELKTSTHAKIIEPYMVLNNKLVLKSYGKETPKVS